MYYNKILFGTLACILSASVEAQDVTLRMAHFAAESHPAHQAALAFAKNVEERTEGAVSVELYPANELGSPPEQLPGRRTRNPYQRSRLRHRSGRDAHRPPR